MEDVKNTKEIIEEKNLSPLALKRWLDSLSFEDKVEALNSIKKDRRLKSWRLLDIESIEDLITSTSQGKEWFRELSLKQQSSLIAIMEENKAEEILFSVPLEERREIIALSERKLPPYLKYDEEEVGSIISNDFIVLNKDISVGDALEKIRDAAENKDNIRIIFLEDENGGLYGEVDLLTILRTNKNEKIKDVATTSFPFISATAPLSKTLEWIRDYNLPSFPVIDDEGKVIGALTNHALLERVESELKEDYRKLASIREEENMGIISSMKARLPWLFILLFLGIVVSSAIGELSSLALGLTLVFSFQSLILDMTGNSGTQTLAVVVRALSGRDLPSKEKRKLIRKESLSGFSIGLILALCSFLFLFPYIFLTGKMGAQYSLFLSLSISIALVLSMTISNLLGGAIPMVMEKVGVDPAIASGPLITTLNDLVGATVYYSTVFFILRKALGF